ncbi:MAG: hypothetical protein JW787_05115 [Sedimentisphaerales bacterium]|nr:hypothetical protein [Sedimentisphaerales bacterium]
MNTKTSLKVLSALLLLSIVCTISQAKFVMPQPVPVDRLIANATAYIKENPKDAQGYYILARINYLAFINKSTQVAAFSEGKDSPPKVAENWQERGYQNSLLPEHARKLAAEELGYSSYSEIPREERKKFQELFNQKAEQLRKENWQPEKITQNKLIQHVTESIDYFKKAIELDPKNGLYHLGFASLLEQYINYVKETDLRAFPEEFRNIILNYAADIYYTAYKLSIKEDLKNERIPLAGLQSLTGYEAGNAYIRLIEQDKNITEEQKKILAEIHKNIDTIAKLRIGAITPIVFSFEMLFSPTDLLDRNLQINFDLDGDGAAELWPWVKPSTGILVWNEDGKNEITSGRQMFGSVTWWLFFNDGYHALNCLDDNRDGALNGSELEGISVWFDTNSNGKSEPVEIKSLDELGIISISTKSTSTENGWPTNKTGIKLTTGKTIPTYDWIASQKP